MRIEDHNRLKELLERAEYIRDIKGEDFEDIMEVYFQLKHAFDNFYELSEEEIESLLKSSEKRLEELTILAEKTLTPYEIVKIARHPQRFTLQDILENVYDSYVELGGEGEINIDPAVVCAKAMLIRRVGDDFHVHQVMVIGHEKGSGEEFRRGGSAAPWGNEKALRYMRMAETEGIPIHFFIFTPGAYPIEDYPGAAQQIARNLYTMSKLQVPMISFISEGGSGGAEAIGLADLRLMAEKGYYSVISPEGAAAIVAKLRDGRPPRELVEKMAKALKLTARDNLELGTIDRIIPEPPLGARKRDYEFFKRLKIELIKATDEVVLKTRGFKTFTKHALSKQTTDNFSYYVDWDLSEDEREILVELRYEKYRKMTQWAVVMPKGLSHALRERGENFLRLLRNEVKYRVLKSGHKTFKRLIDDILSESSLLLKPVSDPVKTVYNLIVGKKVKPKLPTILEEEVGVSELPVALEDRTVTCPQAEKYGCPDIWVPDLYGEFCGVCPNCGYHFFLEYQWYLNNVFDKGSVKFFDEEIASTNPLNFEGHAEKLKEDRKRTGLNSAFLSFTAKVGAISVVSWITLGPAKPSLVDFKAN